MKFIIIDDFIQQHCEIEAESVELAAEKFADSQGRDDCLSREIVNQEKSDFHTIKIPGETVFMDEGTSEGWGPGCKFDGQRPHHQLIFRVIPRG